MNNYKKLNVWIQSHQLTLVIYRVSIEFPKHELFGLTSQLRRASSSIPCNLAEGSSRDSRKDFARFVEIAHGSALEVEYIILLTFDLGYIDAQTYEQLIAEITSISKQLVALRRSIIPKP